MELSYRAASVCVAVATCLAFLGGRATSIYYLGMPMNMDVHTPSPIQVDVQEFKQENKPTKSPKAAASTEEASPNKDKASLPFPVLPTGKKFPKAKYTGMHFSETVSDYENLHLKDVVGQGLDEECFFNDDGRKQCIIDRTANGTGTDGTSTNTDTQENMDTYPAEGDGEEHLPAGQHLMLDIKNVDGAFLDSEHRLANAMVEVVTESKLTLLSYHCHKLIPMGVTCVGILLESHISFHTWPEAGVITLDLFTCGSGKLVPVVPIIEKLFALPRENVDVNVDVDKVSMPMPMTRWWHTFRGFRENHQWGDLGYLTEDLGDYILTSSAIDYKKEIAGIKTPFQRMDIYDTIPASMDYDSYVRSIKKKDDGDKEKSTSTYESQHPELYRPQRTVFLDGKIQSTLKGLEAYHEALVQPAMFSHDNPKRVAIIGGGEGATLREVLKHNTIDVVKMIDIDEEFVKACREYLPEWNDCSDLIGSDVKWCGDDSRAEIHYEDAISWFKDRFSDDDEEEDGEDDDDDGEEEDEDTFDVIIVDALDPEDDIPFAKTLYTDISFLEVLYDALSEEGLMVLQLGETVFAEDPAQEFTWNKRRALLLDLLDEVGFDTIFTYEEGNGGFKSPWSFAIAFKSYDNIANFLQLPAELEVEIHDRILRTRSGDAALRYFDSGVLHNYMYPHKAFESVYCKSVPKPSSCYVQQIFTEKVPDVRPSDLDVRVSGVGDGSGRGVYTKVDIKKGSSIGKALHRYPVLLTPSATDLVEDYKEKSPSINHVHRYMEGYGWENSMRGDNTYLVDSTLLTFMNHGCNGTFNVDSLFGSLQRGTENFITEQNATIDFGFEEESYDPVMQRHDNANHEFDVAVRDIKAGEELTSSYIFYAETKKYWWEDIVELRGLCSGEITGLITQIEMENLKEKERESLRNTNASDHATKCSTCDDEL